MDIKRYLMVLPAVAVMLFAACTNDNNEIVEELQPAQPRIVPFEATVSTGNQTRATLDYFNSYVFETGDKLYVWGDKISGELTLEGTGGSNFGTFKGSLTMEAGCASNPTLYAVVKSTKDEILGTLAEFKARGYEPSYTATIASSDAEAIQKYSYLKAESDYETKSFDFGNKQNSALLSFEVTLEDGTAAEAPVNVSIKNGGSVVRSGSVTTVNDGGVIKAKFTAGFPTGASGTTLSSATIKLDDRTEIPFGGTKTLEADKIYQVIKTYTRYTITASAMSKSQSSSNKAMGYTTTLQTLLANMGLSAYAGMVSSCTKTSGTSINLTDLGGTPHDFQFELVGEGESTFSMNGMLTITISVAKMTPPTP